MAQNEKKVFSGEPATKNGSIACILNLRQKGYPAAELVLIQDFDYMMACGLSQNIILLLFDKMKIYDIEKDILNCSSDISLIWKKFERAAMNLTKIVGI